MLLLRKVALEYAANHISYRVALRFTVLFDHQTFHSKVLDLSTISYLLLARPSLIAGPITVGSTAVHWSAAKLG